MLKASEADTKCYYFNSKTKEVTWLAPPGLVESTPPAPVRTLDMARGSQSLLGPQVFGTTLPIDQVMVEHKSDEEPEYEISQSECDRPRQYSIHGPNTINSPLPLQPPPPIAAAEEVVIPQRQPLPKETPVATKPGWTPVVGQPCGALWIDGHYWKATVVAEQVGGLRYKVMYDVDGSEALVAREALRPPKETKSDDQIKPSPSSSALPSSTNPPPLIHRSSSTASSWATRDVVSSRTELIAKQNLLVQQFTTEFPHLRLPSLEDFYRPQFAEALQRFGQQDFELLCDAQKGRGAIGRIKQKVFK